MDQHDSGVTGELVVSADATESQAYPKAQPTFKKRLQKTAQTFVFALMEPLSSGIRYISYEDIERDTPPIYLAERRIRFGRLLTRAEVIQRALDAAKEADDMWLESAKEDIRRMYLFQDE